jgi:NAD(P)H-nitrite reductase large subunit
MTGSARFAARKRTSSNPKPKFKNNLTDPVTAQVNMKKYLIIGNGAAGTIAAEHIRKNDADGEITIVSKEDLPFYYRVRLPDLLGGKVTEPELIARNRNWYEEKEITLKLQTEIIRTDNQQNKVFTADGAPLDYDSLLLANGSHSFVPPVKGSELDGVFTLHTVNDVRKISGFAQNISQVVLIGGGLLGLETANALHKLGKKITVVEFLPRLLPRQLDIEGAARLQHIFENMNYTFKLGATTREIAGDRSVERVILANDEIMSTEMVIISAGVRPNLELAGMLGLKKDKGIIVDKFLQTSAPDIYAAGDVIEFEGRTYGIWPAAMEQGRIAGINISGGNEAYQGTVLSNILKVAGIDLASAGNIDENNQFESKIVATDTVYKKVVIDNRKIIGCIMLGDRKNFTLINKAVSTGEDILSDLDTLLAV